MGIFRHTCKHCNGRIEPDPDVAPVEWSWHHTVPELDVDHEAEPIEG